MEYYILMILILFFLAFVISVYCLYNRGVSPSVSISRTEDNQPPHYNDRSAIIFQDGVALASQEGSNVPNATRVSPPGYIRVVLREQLRKPIPYNQSVSVIT